MRSTTWILPLLIFLGSPLPAIGAADPLSEPLRHRLELLQQPDIQTAGEQPLHLRESLLGQYEPRTFKPVWFDSEQRPKPALFGLVKAIADAEAEGLAADDYHYQALSKRIQGWQPGRETTAAKGKLVDVELMASDAFLSLAAHYRHGRIDPVSIDPHWHLSRDRNRQLPSLDEASAEQDSPAQLLQAQLPTNPNYSRLRDRLALHRQLQDRDWVTIAAGPTLRPGMEDPRVRLFEARLQLLGDLDQTTDSERYEPPLVEAVQRFQRRHGLDADSLIGPRTLSELNTHPRDRINTLRVNMERWRWLPQDLGEEYILVNIAGYYMDVVQSGHTIMQQRVIVGRPYRQTPVFTGNMTYLVLNPSWEVPNSLAVQDQLPQIRQDLAYLDRMGFSVLQGWGAEERRVNPEEIDWARLGPRNFPYRLRQRPGPVNALGQAKFMFPNRHNVYLHDTPARGLFAQSDRAFSSGCIRVEDPIALTNWLLNGEGRPSVMSGERIRSILAQDQETTVRLGRALPVHLLYWTSWVDEQGQIQYRRDLYQRDARLLQALNTPPPRH